MRTAVLALLAFACPVLAACGEPAPPVGSGASVADAMGATDDDEGYSRADGPRPFVFPADHGPHPDYRTEWWYWTGHLEGSDGHRFGYQLTFFRNALAPPDDGVSPAERPSRWAADQVWLAHFAMTDVTAERFVSASRTARGALGLAGARAEPFRVHVVGWVAEEVDESATSDGRLAVRLTADAGDVSLALDLSRGDKPPVLHGDRGFSTKGSAAPGAPPNASYYFSLTRLPTEGTVTFDGEPHAVTGSSWLDREWFTGALTREQIGWNWFSLQLSDGRELMLFALRHRDGTFDPRVSGTLVEADGAFRSLSSDLGDEIVIEPTGATWESPRSGAVYPAGWRLAVPSAGIDLTVRSLVADQELDVGFRYFEGVVGAEGESAGRPVTGTGYAELTGYAEDGELPGR